jgi:quercetin dioxygenase-like cupin family protein
MRKIAEALEVPLPFFMQDSSRQSRVVRRDARPHLDLQGHAVAYDMLTPDLSHKMEAIIGSLEPGTGNIMVRLRVPTEEFILVLSGVLKVVVEDDQYILETGDSVYFEGQGLKEISCASANKVTWISVITPPVF